MSKKAVMNFRALSPNGATLDAMSGEMDCTANPISMGSMTNKRSGLPTAQGSAGIPLARTGTAKGMNATVTTEVSRENGATYDRSPRAFFTNAGKNVAPGAIATKIIPAAYDCSSGTTLVSK